MLLISKKNDINYVFVYDLHESYDTLLGICEEKNMTNKRKLRFFPIMLFASVMGIAGVSIAMSYFEQVNGFQPLISWLFFFTACLLFLINGGILLYRLGRYKEDVINEFNHPIKMNFFGAISISLLLISVPILNIYSNLSFIIWFIGMVFQLILTLSVLSKLIWKHQFQINVFNATWFIPLVGNIVVPLAGVEHVSMSINWIFFSIGLLFSIIYMTLFIYRVYFHPAFPEPLKPSFFILLAPPGIGFSSYIRLTGELDGFAWLLYGVAFYLGLLFIIQFKRFFTGRFYISWWAYLFPSAAVTNATYLLYINTNESLFKIIFQIQSIGLIILSIFLTWKTIELIRKRKLCVPGPASTPNK